VWGADLENGRIQKNVFVVLSKLICALGHTEIVEDDVFLRITPLHSEKIIRSDDAIPPKKLP
jgi:hypothetical protein